jgi:hypothetical protein
MQPPLYKKGLFYLTHSSLAEALLTCVKERELLQGWSLPGTLLTRSNRGSGMRMGLFTLKAQEILGA